MPPHLLPSINKEQELNFTSDKEGSRLMPRLPVDVGTLPLFLPMSLLERVPPSVVSPLLSPVAKKDSKVVESSCDSLCIKSYSTLIDADLVVLEVPSSSSGTTVCAASIMTAINGPLRTSSPIPSSGS
mmetsp:Transcript_45981/g.112215  ORF Transcript_45981/g.112215 Transcript_45981/m.112215 type:complete len:128 (-) Transcript_45981:1555-1938(-)